MTKNEILRRYPNASPAFIKNNLDPEDTWKNTGMEPDIKARPLAKVEAKETNTARFLVRFTSVRKRLLDEDGICEKYYVDCCRYSGLIPSDDAATTRIETTQRKVEAGEEEHAEITIYETT